MMVRKNTGFTLLELLVAMVIFSFMAIMAYGALANIFNSNARISQQEQNLKSLKRAMMVMERDIRQIVMRPSRQGYDQSSPALVSGFNEEGIIDFTRAGNTNPLELVRSSLQRVRYTLQEGQLVRKSWNIVDHIDAEPLEMPLLDDVEAVTFRFLDADKWDVNWDSTRKKALPQAIELTIKHKSWGKIVRLFPIR